MFGSISSSLLILIAVILCILTIASLIVWLRDGSFNILLPGLGLIVSGPALIVFLLVLTIAFVIVAAIIKPQKEFASETRLEQNFEYPNDIFGGCGNGVLDLSVTKDPNNYNPNTDRGLKVCFNQKTLFIKIIGTEISKL